MEEENDNEPKRASEMNRRSSMKSSTGSGRQSSMANATSPVPSHSAENRGNNSIDGEIGGDYGEGVNGKTNITSVDVAAYERIINEKEKLEAMYANQMNQLSELRFVS